uniref:Uncharacterized protein n=1 Tax=Romanomermis culicivorax TaxID=13658 RepID=A0A915HWN9_ROMCU
MKKFGFVNAQKTRKKKKLKNAAAAAVADVTSVELAVGRKIVSVVVVVVGRTSDGNFRPDDADKKSDGSVLTHLTPPTTTLGELL